MIERVQLCNSGIIHDCIRIQRALNRLLRDISNETARKELDCLFMRWFTTDEHRAINPPQRNLILEGLADVMQIIDEIKSEDYRKQHQCAYESIILDAYKKFTGETVYLQKYQFGNGATDLWNWAEGRPRWCNILEQAVRKTASQGELQTDLLGEIWTEIQNISPGTIAGHLTRVILGEMICSNKSLSSRSNLAKLGICCNLLEGSTNQVDWDRIEQLLQQLLGERRLVVERVYCGWRTISSSLW